MSKISEYKKLIAAKGTIYDSWSLGTKDDKVVFSSSSSLGLVVDKNISVSAEPTDDTHLTNRKYVKDLFTNFNLENGEGLGSIKMSKGNCTAKGAFAFSSGYYTEANGGSTYSGGYYSISDFEYSISYGISTRTQNGVLAAFGRYNNPTTGHILEVGNGSEGNNRSNAFAVLTDGRAKVQSAPTEDDDVVRKKELDTKLNIIPNSIFDITLYGYQHNRATGFNLDTNSISYSIPYRNASGKFLVGDLKDSDNGETVVNKNALDRKLDKTGGTITGSLIIAQNLVVNGTTSTVDTQNLKVADKLIYVAKDNTVALTSPAGLITPKYDGTNSGGIVYDSTGTAYVGDITLDSSGNVDVDNSDLQPIATRSIAITNGHLVKWDDTSKKLVDSGKSIDNLVQQINTLNSIAYGKSEGNELYWRISSYADASTLAYRLSKGRLKVGVPTENDDATTKLYVDDLLDKKLDKSSLANVLYGTNSDKNQTTIHYAEFGDSGSIVQRNSAGNVYTGTPTEDWESTPKNYTDSSIKKVEKSLIVMEHIVGTLDSKTGKYKYVNKSLYLPIAFYDNTSGVQILLQVTATADGYIATSDNEFNVWAMCWNDKYGGQDFTEGSSDPNDWS